MEFGSPALHHLDDAVRAYVERYGLNGFYDNEDAKKACCQVRKVAPLNFALAGASALADRSTPRAVRDQNAAELSEADDARQNGLHNIVTNVHIREVIICGSIQHKV